METLVQSFFPGRPEFHLLHHGEGIILEVFISPQPVILKVISSFHEPSEELQARLGWIAFLSRNGLNVPKLVANPQGNWIEQIQEDGKWYTAYAYEEIPITDKNVINWKDPTMSVKLGEVMGKMHRLAKTYLLQPGPSGFSHVQNAPWLYNPAESFHPSQQAIFGPIIRLGQRIAQFPKNPNIYGLIHDDLHTGNVFSLEGELVIIDFDCCLYHWFAADIASALLFRVWIGPEKEKLRSEAQDFLRGLLQGYRMQCELPQGWTRMLPDLLKLRELSLYWDYRSFDLKREIEDHLFWYVYDSIRLERPFLEIDYGKF